jgi:hypothetical protein
MSVETAAAMAALLISAVALAISALILIAYGRAEKRLIMRRLQHIRQASTALLHHRPL